MATKNAVLQMIIENVLTDIMLRGQADNIIVNKETGETLATRLASITAATAGFIKRSEMEGYVTQKLSELIADAPATADTLLELANLISDNADVIETLNSAIGNKVDKVSGKGLSANDFTDVLLTKLNGIASQATKVTPSEANGCININGEEVQVYKESSESGHKLPPGGATGEVLRAVGDGKGEWGLAIRSGVSAPENLLPGELFIKILS